MGGLYWFAEAFEKKDRIRLDEVKAGFLYSKGIITGIKSHKGHSIRVRYKIGEEIFETTNGWDSNPNRLSVGDSISLRYSVKNPENIITELEEEF